MKKSRNLTALLLCLAFAAVLGFTGRAAADEPYTYRADFCRRAGHV
jgi:hypothetical protein